MYLYILNDNMVCFANITDREILDDLILTYGNITAVDWENNFEKCAAHGTLRNLLSPFSNRFNIVMIVIK
jgi:hypothetical protein